MSLPVSPAAAKPSGPKTLAKEGCPSARQTLVLEIEVLEERIAPTTNLMDACAKGVHLPTVIITV